MQRIKNLFSHFLSISYFVYICNIAFWLMISCLFQIGKSPQKTLSHTCNITQLPLRKHLIHAPSNSLKYTLLFTILHIVRSIFNSNPNSFYKHSTRHSRNCIHMRHIFIYTMVLYTCTMHTSHMALHPQKMHIHQFLTSSTPLDIHTTN